MTLVTRLTWLSPVLQIRLPIMNSDLSMKQQLCKQIFGLFDSNFLSLELTSARLDTFKHESASSEMQSFWGDNTIAG